MINKPRKPWIAGLLTFFTIGLGHLYCGNVRKGIILFSGGQVFLLLGFSSFLLSSLAGPVIAIIAGVSYFVYCISDSIKGARLLGPSYSLKKYNKWYIYLMCWFIASGVIQTIVETAVKHNIAQAYKIPSGAMKPTLQVGDHIFADKFTYIRSEPKRGDIAIFPFPKDPSKEFIKRIVGLSGETIEIRDKQVFINGEIYREPYKVISDKNIFPRNVQPRDNYGPIKIPEDSLFVMGDNRDHSYDSRFWGFIKKAVVKGKAKSIYWSWDKNNFKVRWDRICYKIE